MLKPGQPAPDFNLVDTDKQTVTLADYKGKNLMLLFFPFAWTGTCTKEVCLMRDDVSVYTNLNSEILAVSVDSPHALRRFKEDYNLNYRVASDFNKEAIEAYGARYDSFSLGMRGVAKRSAFVIDKEGIIRYAEVLENASDLPDFEKVKEVLQSLRIL